MPSTAARDGEELEHVQEGTAVGVWSTEAP